MAESPDYSEDLQNTSFSIAFRGYDRDEVDAYVAELEELLRAGRTGVQGTSRAELAELLGEEIGAVLAAAEDAAVAIKERAEETGNTSAREAEKILEQALADAAKTRAEAADDSQRMLQEAELKSKRLENAAKQRHDEMLAEAQTRIKVLRERERELLTRIDALEKAFISMRHAADDIYKRNAPAIETNPDHAAVADLIDSEPPGKT